MENRKLLFADAKAPTLNGFCIHNKYFLDQKDMQIMLEVEGFMVLNEMEGKFYWDLIGRKLGIW